MKYKVAELIRDQPTVFSYTELARMASAGAIARAIQAGDPVRLLPGLYASRLHASAFSVRTAAAAAWWPEGSCIGGAAALFVHGAAAHPPTVIDVMVPYGCHRPSPPWLRLSAPRKAQPFVGVLGVSVARPAHALVHAFGREDRRRRSEVVYEALRSGVVHPSDVLEALDGTARARGRKALKLVLNHAAAGSESYLEQRASTNVFTGDAFSELLRQHDVVVEGERFRLDAFDAQTKTAFELDGMRVHGTAAARLRDSRRDALVATAGILTVRFSYRDVMERPAWCRTVALRVLRDRGAQRAA